MEAVVGLVLSGATVAGARPVYLVTNFNPKKTIQLATLVVMVIATAVAKS